MYVFSIRVRNQQLFLSTFLGLVTRSCWLEFRWDCLCLRKDTTDIIACHLCHKKNAVGSCDRNTREDGLQLHSSSFQRASIKFIDNYMSVLLNAFVNSVNQIEYRMMLDKVLSRSNYIFLYEFVLTQSLTNLATKTVVFNNLNVCQISIDVLTNHFVCPKPFCLYVTGQRAPRNHVTTLPMI